LVGLEEVNLRSNGLTAESARLLASWPGLRSVRVLQLAGNALRVGGARDLLASEYLTNLEELELPGAGVRPPESRRIETLPAARRIRYVHFSS
jgi:hypothetical protein